MSIIALAAAALSSCKDPKPAKPATTPSGVASPTRTSVEKSETPNLVRAEPLPQVARAALRKRMQNHGDDTENLLWAALMLDFESTDGIAKMISKAPTLTRPGEGDLDTINAMLPAQFFDLQDQLDAAILGLQAAAQAKDGNAVALQYGKSVETCITCHSLFLQFPVPE